MGRLRLFIASSSESIEVARAIRLQLLDELEHASVELWTRAFDLSATYIESLEKVVDAADFAILLLTPDDTTTSRDQQRFAPRDNVVFELGLFMGCMGRQRCFLIQEDNRELRLPTDLLGVNRDIYALR